MNSTTQKSGVLLWLMLVAVCTLVLAYVLIQLSVGITDDVIIDGSGEPLAGPVITDDIVL